jgi:hypothetical protein
MATERQISANRRNARNSTGPRSRAGKARTRRNAQTHGLAACLVSNTEREASIETLARDIVGDATDFGSLAAARAAAQADCDLARIRRVKAELIVLLLSETTATGDPSMAQTVQQALRRLVAIDRYERSVVARRQRAIQALLEERRRAASPTR